MWARKMVFKNRFQRLFFISLLLILSSLISGCQEQRSELGNHVLDVPRGALLDIRDMVESLTKMTELRLDNILSVLEELKTEQSEIKQRVDKIAASVSFVEAWLRPDMSIYFGFNQTNLRESDKSKLLRLARIVRELDSGMNIELRGYTDSTGSSNYNHWLGLARAKSVREYLIHVGNVDPEIITQRSFGEMRKYQFSPNAEGQSAALNRRVELIVKYNS